jgi:biopolymer transport protein ExbD
MAAKLSGPSGKYDLGQNHDMNVTPFVDVMLVLLIIFMVAAPLATVAIKVDIPPAVTPDHPPDKKPVFISIQEGGKVFIVDAPTDLDRLGTDLFKALAAPDVADPKDQTVLIRADAPVKYREFMAVVNQLQTDGFYRIGLISEDLTGA